MLQGLLLPIKMKRPHVDHSFHRSGKAMSAIVVLYLLVATSLSWTSAFLSNGPSALNPCRSSLSNKCLKASSPKGSDTKAKAKKAVAKLGSPKKSTKVSKEAKKTEEIDEPKEIVFKKPEFIDKMAQKTGMTKTASEAALAAVLEIITDEVSAGKRVLMVGFGTFKLNQREARKGRNPKTGEEIDISASKYPSFQAGKSFKESCNI